MRDLTNITYDEVFNLINRATSLDLSNSLSHRITLISPGVTRNIHTVSIVTPYIEGLLRRMHDDHVLEASARQFQVFNGFSKGKSSAGYILDGGIHGALCKERTWQVVPLKANPPGTVNTHWKLPKPADNVLRYLTINYKNGLVSVDVSDTPPLPNVIGGKTLPVFTYLSGAKLTLQDGYYRPSSSSEPTFDSFIIESRIKTATTIQSTVSPKHGVSRKGLKWLRDQGVEKIRR